MSENTDSIGLRAYAEYAVKANQPTSITVMFMAGIEQGVAFAQTYPERARELLQNLNAEISAGLGLDLAVIEDGERGRADFLLRSLQFAEEMTR